MIKIKVQDATRFIEYWKKTCKMTPSICKNDKNKVQDATRFIEYWKKTFKMTPSICNKTDILVSNKQWQDC